MKYLSFLMTLCFLCSLVNLNAQGEEFGLASYFSDTFQGRDTAYGDTYDRNEMSCAHRRYPYGTRVRVTRLDNNKSVVVKVIDQGPFIQGRVVDLSYRAAKELGILDMGSVKVKVEKTSNAQPVLKEEPASVLDKPADEDNSLVIDDRPEPQVNIAPKPVEEKIPQQEEIQKEERIDTPKGSDQPTKAAVKVNQAKSRTKLVGNDYAPYGLYKFALEKPEDGGYGVQVASFSSFDNVLKKVANLQAKWFENILISMEAGTDGNNQYKVILGPFATQKEAQHYQASMKSRYSIRGFVVNLTELKY